TQARRPYSIADGEPHDFWDLSLEDVISISLQNTKVIRAGSQAPVLSRNGVSPGSGQLTNGGSNPIPLHATIFDPALRETDAGEPSAGRLNDNSAGTGRLGPGQLLSVRTIGGGVGGVEAALSEFDLSFNTRLFWDKSDRAQNFFAFQPFIKNDSANFVSELSKKTASGTHLFFRNTTSYEHANTNFLRDDPVLLVNSAYTTAFEFEARQPLFRGRGTMINRIGIVNARIGTDQEIATLEANLQNFLANIEVRYWDLYCAYREFETAKKGRDSALSAWRDVQTKVAGGILAGQDEARAREQFFNFRNELENALWNLYSTEEDLRFLMGLAATDGKLIRPSAKPTQARIQFDWAAINAEAIARRPDLRIQRWQIKKNELQLAYAKNALLPEINAFALYRFVGVGDHLTGANRNGQNFAPGTAVGSRAFDELTGGKFQEASFGIEMNLPIGFRKELSAVRNAQLVLARQRALVEDLELNASHELSAVVRALDTYYQLAQTHLNRWMAAEEEVEKRNIVQEQIDSNELDRLLDAQVRRANAQIAHYRSLCEYNKLIALIHLRKGSILDYCGIQFGEGPWPKKAYYDALGHARRRDASYYLNYGWTRPGVVSRGTVPTANGGEIVEEIIIEEILPGGATPEPTPAAEPDESDMSSAHFSEPSRPAYMNAARAPSDARGQNMSQLGISIPNRRTLTTANRPSRIGWKPTNR
ncbi:MAG: TolC family protein, partial [Planctomycetes bacterium]|nr:TolC family protein [Planctomycetota bacterium]